MRIGAKVKAEAFANLGISRSMVFRYEKAEINPTFDKVIILADFFGVSLDYLAGRSENPQREKFVPGMAEIKK